MRKIHITEAQLKSLTETVLSGDQALTDNNGNTNQAAKDTIEGARKSGMPVDNNGTTVGFSRDALKQNGVVSENKYDVYTKKQLKEARLTKLMSESKKYKKSEL